MNSEQKLLHLVSLKTSAECFPFMRDIAGVYSSLFVLDDDEPTGFTDIMPFKFDTKDARPVKLKPYRVPVCHQDEVNKQDGGTRSYFALEISLVFASCGS